MKSAILISADETRSFEIRSSIIDTGLDVYRQYSSSSALLAALPTVNADVDLIVVDQVVEPMNVWDLTREISARYPALATIAVINSPQPEDYSRAMESNVRSIVSYPLQYEDVSQKVKSALSWVATVRSVVGDRSSLDSSAGNQGKMVTISGSKGGVGTTTIATHLAIEAQKSAPDMSIVLVDLDVQKPDLSIVLNTPQYRTITDLLAVVDELNPRQLDEVLFKSTAGFSVLFGPINGEDSELITEPIAKRIMGMLRSRFDMVIVDTGSTIGEANSVAIEMADEAYIVATSDVLSLRGARRLGQLWKRLGIRPTENSKVILNKVDKKQDLQPESSKKIVGMPIVPEYIPESIRSIELAMNQRDPSQVTPAWSARIMRLGVEMGIARQTSLSLPEKSKVKRSPRSRKRRKAEKGSSAIEFLGVTLFFCFIAVLGFQAIMVGMTWIYASGAANEGARAASVGHSATAAANEHTPVTWRKNMHVVTTPTEVKVSIKSPTVVPQAKMFQYTINTSAGIVSEK
ncbi:AAA family ATPase [Brevibacterium paucivorans]|uniref:AAA family ATPase n=1 Tax=Brevibacterium paucivorans TaxID=170994 RepID=UPI00321B7210